MAVPEKMFKAGIQREPGWLYYFDNGNVMRTKMIRGGDKKNPKDRPELVLITGLIRENGFIYYLDKQGDVARSIASRGGEAKKKSAAKTKSSPAVKPTPVLTPVIAPKPVKQKTQLTIAEIAALYGQDKKLVRTLRKSMKKVSFYWSTPAKYSLASVRKLAKKLGWAEINADGVPAVPTITPKPKIIEKPPAGAKYLTFKQIADKYGQDVKLVKKLRDCFSQSWAYGNGATWNNPKFTATSVVKAAKQLKWVEVADKVPQLELQPEPPKLPPWTAYGAGLGKASYWEILFNNKVVMVVEALDVYGENLDKLVAETPGNTTTTYLDFFQTQEYGRRLLDLIAKHSAFGVLPHGGDPSYALLKAAKELGIYLNDRVQDRTVPATIEAPAAPIEAKPSSKIPGILAAAVLFGAGASFVGSKIEKRAKSKAATREMVSSKIAR